MYQQAIEKQHAISDLSFANKRSQTAVTFEKGQISDDGYIPTTGGPLIVTTNDDEAEEDNPTRFCL
jgi:hypothetical protein